MFSKLFDEVSSFIKNPYDKTIDIITQPIKDCCEIVDGLTEGELRGKAIIRLGADIVAGMTLDEVIGWYLISGDDE